MSLSNVDVKGSIATVSFVILTVVAIGIAAGVGAWMHTTPEEAQRRIEEEADPEDINFFIDELEKGNGHANFTIVNNGRFEFPADQLTGYYEGDNRDIEKIEGPETISPGESATYRIYI